MLIINYDWTHAVVFLWRLFLNHHNPLRAKESGHQHESRKNESFSRIFHYSNWLQGKFLKHVTYLTYWSIRIDAYHWKREIPMFYRLVSFAADVYENLVFWWYYDVSVAKMHYYKGQLSSPFRKPKYDILKVEVNKFTFV